MQVQTRCCRAVFLHCSFFPGEHVMYSSVSPRRKKKPGEKIYYIVDFSYKTVSPSRFCSDFIKTINGNTLRIKINVYTPPVCIYIPLYKLSCVLPIFFNGQSLNLSIRFMEYEKRNVGIYLINYLVWQHFQINLTVRLSVSAILSRLSPCLKESLKELMNDRSCANSVLRL